MDRSQLGFQITGKSGERLKVFSRPEQPLFVDKVAAWDNHLRPGATRIFAVFVGNKIYYHAEMLREARRLTESPSPASSDFSMANIQDYRRICGDEKLHPMSCPANLDVAIEIEFLEDCTFAATFEGTNERPADDVAPHFVRELYQVNYKLIDLIDETRPRVAQIGEDNLKQLESLQIELSNFVEMVEHKFGLDVRFLEGKI